jgi:hypothetical protein
MKLEVMYCLFHGATVLAEWNFKSYIAYFMARQALASHEFRLEIPAVAEHSIRFCARELWVVSAMREICIWGGGG